MDVFIDGVRYIPAKHVNANYMEIAKGLLLFFWGECDDETAQNLIDSGDIVVRVSDYGEGEPLRDVLDEIAKIAIETKS